MAVPARRQRPTPLLALNELVYSYGHASLGDADTLMRLLDEIGFMSARVCEFGQSALDPVPDSEHRKEQTVYFEAVKL
jgi:hypothetical protein